MACDPFWNKTVLACHFDGSNGSTTFADECGHTLTANGSAQISTTQSKFGGASGYFAGSANRLTIPDSPDFYIGASDFTIEAWIYPTLLDSSGRAFISQANNLADNANRQFAVQLSSSGVTFYWTTDGSSDQSQAFACTIQANVWQHVAVVRVGNVLMGFLNGGLITSVAHTATYFNSTADVCVGTFGKYSENGYPQLSFNGYIDDLRITKAARYTANFTPDTSAFLTNQCTISGTVKDATGAFAAKTVRAFRRDTGALVGTTVSNATTGAYSIDAADGEHFVVAYDSSANPPSGGTENAVILDRVVPV